MLSTGTAVYLDTCIVGAVVNGDHPDQISAISALFSAHSVGGVCLVSSTEVLTEIQQLPTRYQGPHRAVYNQLLQLPASNVTWVDPALATPSITTDPDFEKLRRILPQEMDVRNVFQAVKARVPYYATVDQKTVLSRRPQLESNFSTKFGTPNTVVGWLGLSVST